MVEKGQPNPAHHPESSTPGFVWLAVPAGKLARWALVLESQAIAHRVVRRSDGYGFLLARSDLSAAVQALEAFERENAEAVPRRLPPRPLGHPAVGIGAALVLVLTFLLAPPTRAPDTAYALGAAHAGAIRHGELWRTVTALTLHADMLHLLSNIAAIGLFAALLASVTGAGGAAVLLLLSGAIGNALNAWAQPVWHQSVGASTSVFGAIGALVGLRIRGRLAEDVRGRYPVWIPLLSGTLLLALFGTSPHSDISAHVLGFLAGTVLGFAAGFWPAFMDRRPVQAALVVLSLLAVLGSWWWALRPAG